MRRGDPEIGRVDAARGRRSTSPSVVLGGLVAMPAVVAAALVAVPSTAFAQCFPPPNSNEAKLLAHYEVPLNFATLDVPTVVAPWKVTLTGELTGVPAPSASISQTSYCYLSKQDGTHLSPVLPRLRVALSFPAGFGLEASYLPPITIDQATPNLGSFAATYAHDLIAPSEGGPTVTIGGRIWGTFGRVVGPVTCPSSALQQTQPNEPCYGTQQSSDTFYPNSYGASATVGVANHHGLGGFAGLGYSWQDPHFRVGFTNLNDVTDHTLVEVFVRQASIFGGITVPIVSGLDGAAEVYSVPASLTTWRVSIRYVIP